MYRGFYYASVVPEHFRERLRRAPLRGILVICGTVLLIGMDRRGMLATIWIVGWAAFFMAKFAISVKRKVDQKTIKN